MNCRGRRSFSTKSARRGSISYLATGKRLRSIKRQQRKLRERYHTDAFIFHVVLEPGVGLASNLCCLYRQRTVMIIQPDDMSSEALQSEPVMERKEVLSTFEDAYRCIKEATGVTNIQVWRSSPSMYLLQFTYGAVKSICPLLICHTNVSDQTNFSIRQRQME